MIQARYCKNFVIFASCTASLHLSPWRTARKTWPTAEHRRPFFASDR